MRENPTDRIKAREAACRNMKKVRRLISIVKFLSHYKPMKMSVLFFLFLVFFGCNKQAGTLGVSGSIDESRKRGVFIQEYTCNPNPYHINDTLQITVKTAWIEQKWAYSSNANETIVIEGYQLCIKSVESDLFGLNSKWTIGIDGDKYIRISSKNSLISDFIDCPLGDTISYQVQMGSSLSDHGKKDIIGFLELVPSTN